MWIPPYNRLTPPPETDNSSFGRVYDQHNLVDSFSKCGVNRKVNTFDGIFIPESRVYGGSGEPLRPYAACDVTIHNATADPVCTTLFSPDHAALITNHAGDSFLLKETLSHSELFFSEYFRCDVSTNWEFRGRDDFIIDINISSLVANCYHRYWFNYFHWTLDLLPRIWLIHKYFSGLELKWFVGPVEMAYQQPLLDLFSISPDKCIPFSANTIYRFEHCINSTVRFDEPLKTLRPSFVYGTYNTGWMPDYIYEIRQLALSAYGRSESSFGERLYIDRRDAKHRRIINDEEVRDVLIRFGFRSIDPGSLSIQEQIRAFMDAKFIVGAHGAGLTNILWSKPGASILEFMPETLNDIGYRFLAALANHSHSLIVCRANEHFQGLPYADIDVDINVLIVALEEMGCRSTSSLF